MQRRTWALPFSHCNLYFKILNSQRTFLNIVQTTLSSWLNSDHIDTTERPKTVIWDSGSSMSITNDRSEFIVDEYEALP